MSSLSQQRYVRCAPRPSEALGAVLGVLLAWIGLPQVALAQNAPTREQVLAGWERLALESGRSSGSMTYVNEELPINASDGTSKGEVSIRYQATFTNLGTHWMLSLDGSIRDDPNRVMTRTVYCSNDDYSFILGQGANELYMLKWIERGSAGRDMLRKRAFVYGYMGQRLSFWLPDEILTLPEMASYKEFAISGARTVEGDPALQELTIQYRPTGEGAKRDPSIRTATLVVEPGKDFRLIEARTRSNGGAGHLRVQYVDQGPHWAIREAVISNLYGPQTVVETYRMDYGEKAASSPADFRLPAFGLAELPPESKPRTWLLWVAAGVLFLGGCIWRWRAQAGAGSVAPESPVAS